MGKFASAQHGIVHGIAIGLINNMLYLKKIFSYSPSSGNAGALDWEREVLHRKSGMMGRYGLLLKNDKRAALKALVGMKTSHALARKFQRNSPMHGVLFERTLDGPRSPSPKVLDVFTTTMFRVLTVPPDAAGYTVCDRAVLAKSRCFGPRNDGWLRLDRN